MKAAQLEKKIFALKITSSRGGIFQFFTLSLVTTTRGFLLESAYLTANSLSGSSKAGRAAHQSPKTIRIYQEQVVRRRSWWWEEINEEIQQVALRVITIDILTNKPSIFEPEKSSFQIKWDKHARKPIVMEIAEKLKTQRPSLSRFSSANSALWEIKLMREKQVRAVQSWNLSEFIILCSSSTRFFKYYFSEAMQVMVVAIHLT